MTPYYERDGITIFNADCRELLATMPAGSVDAVVTDPPYEITATGGGIARSLQYLADIKGFTDTGFDYGLLSAFENWVCWGTLRQVPKLIEAAGSRRWMLVTWNKPNSAPLCYGNYLPDTEYAIHAWTGKALYGECRSKSRFMVVPATQNKVHPNEKPVAIMEKCVTNASDKGQTILDPFAGSCTTGVAAWNLGRKAILCEIDEKYCELGAKRLDRVISQGRLFKPEPVRETQATLEFDE